MTEQELLEGARDLIRDNDRWVTEVYAAGTREDGSLDTDILGENAVSWCAIGALHKIAGITPFDAFYGDQDVDNVGVLKQARGRITNIAIAMGYHSGAAGVNDYGGHAKVMEMYDYAITELKNADNRDTREGSEYNQR